MYNRAGISLLRIKVLYESKPAPKVTKNHFMCEKYNSGRFI